MKGYRNKVGTLAAVMLGLTLVTTSVVSGLMARYVVSSSGVDTARVAVMAGNVSLDLSDVIMISPGEEKIVPVELSNYEGDVICEAAQRYTMTVEYISDQFNPNLPLKYAVYTNEGCTEPDGGSTIEADGAMIPGITGEFEAGIKDGPDRYWIKVIWPSGENSAYYAFEIDALKIRVCVEQID